MKHEQVTTFYKLTMSPHVMVIDPLTGARLEGWDGFVSAERLLEVLMPYMEHGPSVTGSALPVRGVHAAATPAGGGVHTPAGAAENAAGYPRESSAARYDGDGTMGAPIDMSGTGLSKEEEEIARAIAASLEQANGAGGGTSDSGKGKGKAKEPADGWAPDGAPDVTVVDDGEAGEETAPFVDPEAALRDAAAILPPEPAAAAADNARIAVRLPDGQRKQRRFLKTESLKVLFDWCRSLVGDAAIGKGFKLSAFSAPGAEPLEETRGRSIQDAGLEGTLLAMVWT